MPETMEEMLARIEAESPRIPGVQWPMALAVSILRTLEKEHPGFRDRVRATVELAAESMETSGDADQVADAPSMRELAESWVFNEPTPAD